MKILHDIPEYAGLKKRFRRAFLGMGIGVVMEVLVVVSHFFITQERDDGLRFFSENIVDLFVANALFGFLGTLIWVFGLAVFIRLINVSRQAVYWTNAGSLAFILFKVMDIINSYHHLYLRDLLHLGFDLDMLIMNVLLSLSGFSLVFALVKSLLDSHEARLALAAHNLRLDLEVRERRLLTAAVDNAAESMVVTDVDGIIQYVNPAFEKINGYLRKEMVGKSITMLQGSHQEDSFYERLWETIQGGNIWKGRFFNKRKDGTLSIQDATISPITDNNGVITHFVSVQHDVTRERRLEQQLQQAHHLEAIAMLAGGIAHDLNNTLSVILGRGEMGLESLAEGHPARVCLDAILRAARRSTGLIKQLLAFSRQNTGEAGPLDMVQFTREQLKVIRAMLPATIALRDSLPPNAGQIVADAIEAQQVLFNLCINASQAMQPDGGTIDLSLCSMQFREATVMSTGTLQPGWYVRLRVSDTGCGMSPETQQKIFEPFFTTKEVGKGTGLGLSMVYGSVNRAGGAIDVASAPGQGSSFDIYWPQYHAPE